MGLSHDTGHVGTDPLPRRSRLKNLFFAGQSIGHSGVLGAMINGFVMARAIVGKDLAGVEAETPLSAAAFRMEARTATTLEAS